MLCNPFTKQLVSLLLLALPASCVHAADPPIPTNLAPPPGAAAAGFKRLVFQEEFTDLEGIDIDDTRKPGFNFYPKLAWGKYVLPKEHIRVEDGVLHLTNPKNNAQSDLFSAVSDKYKSGDYIGFAIGGGAYFEASIAFDPDYLKKNRGIEGFPAFYSNPVEHFFFKTPLPYEYLELDHMEYNSSWYPDRSDYFHALIKWTVDRTGLHRDFVDPVWKRRIVDPPGEPDFNTFNTFAALWIPGVDGRVDTYFNNQLCRSLTAKEYPKLRVGDQQHFIIILAPASGPSVSTGFASGWNETGSRSHAQYSNLGHADRAGRVVDRATIPFGSIRGTICQQEG